MQNITTEIAALGKEFDALRAMGVRRFPEDLWHKAISLARRASIDKVGAAIKIARSYLRRKMQEMNISSQTMHLAQAIIPQNLLCQNITASIETSQGHRLKIEGLTGAELSLLIKELTRG